MPDYFPTFERELKEAIWVVEEYCKYVVKNFTPLEALNELQDCKNCLWSLKEEATCIGDIYTIIEDKTPNIQY